MKTRILLTAVSLLAANTFAQVHSTNVVGYVNVSIPANKLAILGVPLNGISNDLNTLIVLPPGDCGVIYRFDVGLQNYRDPINWFDGVGWFSPSDPNPTINPGEGFWLQNVCAVDLPFVFMGEILGGTYNNALPGGNNLKLASSIVPRADTLTGLGFPTADGDTEYAFDVATQNYKEPYNYFAGFGWFSANPDDPGPLGPVIQVATGFWTQIPGPGKTWTQIFRVSD